jgi:hypothetical protein
LSRSVVCALKLRARRCTGGSSRRARAFSSLSDNGEPVRRKVYGSAPTGEQDRFAGFRCPLKARVGYEQSSRSGAPSSESVGLFVAVITACRARSAGLETAKRSFVSSLPAALAENRFPPRNKPQSRLSANGGIDAQPTFPDLSSRLRRRRRLRGSASAGLPRWTAGEVHIAAHAKDGVAVATVSVDDGKSADLRRFAPSGPRRDAAAEGERDPLAVG